MNCSPQWPIYVPAVKPHFQGCDCQLCMAAVEEMNKLRFTHIDIDNTPSGLYRQMGKAT